MANPLVSISVASTTLTLLYLPNLLLCFITSPVLLSTSLLLAILLHFGSTQSPKPQQTDPEPQIPKWVDPVLDPQPVFDPKKPPFSEVFVEWSRRGPLEVIYEEYEGEEEDMEDDDEEEPEIEREMYRRRFGFESLELCFPDTDTGSSSDGDFPVMDGWESPRDLCFRWEDDKDGLIEIPLETFEEDNLIEIDIAKQR
ncbi:hypothetical protein QJS04_geneDACA003172 [Acorus gramineus]|uniref:Uncharacterized protein n=1 Tax=Acorus gramineus TaxID=55184 RepID=A0AAV9BTH5_ACOGR|nr:hypothetical protein QJS04_geneDACA003172 [Acorus gramineus]